MFSVVGSKFTLPNLVDNGYIATSQSNSSSTLHCRIVWSERKMTTGDVFQTSEKVTVPMKTSCVHSHVPNNFPCSPHVFYLFTWCFFVSKRSPALRSFPPDVQPSCLWYRFLDLWPGLWFRDFGWRSFSGNSESGDCEGMYIMYHYICIILHKSNVGQNITSSSGPRAWVSQASYL